MKNSHTSLYNCIILNIPEHHKLLAFYIIKLLCIVCVGQLPEAEGKTNHSLKCLFNGNWLFDFHFSNLISKGKSIIENPVFSSEYCIRGMVDLKL